MGQKSKIACEFSVGRMPDPHMWTFTFPVKIPPRHGAALWRKLAKDLVRMVGMWGVRVYEPHPNGHGLHVHAVVSGRYDVNLVRRYAERHGFGRIHVCKVDSPEYVSKYLTKSRRNDQWKGVRLWASFGVKRSHEWQPSRVKDIQVESPTGTLYRKLALLLHPKSHHERYRLLKLCEKCTLGVLRYRITESTTGYITTLSGKPPALDNPSDWLRVSGSTAFVTFLDNNSNRVAITIYANLIPKYHTGAA